MTWTLDTLLQAIDEAREIYVAVRLTEAVTYAALTQAAARDLIRYYHEARPDSLASLDVSVRGDVLRFSEWPSVTRWTFAASHARLLEHMGDGPERLRIMETLCEMMTEKP